MHPSAGACIQGVATAGPGALPDIHYSGGGLEDPRVRDPVCQYLEDGAEALRKRSERYGSGVH